MSEDEEEIPPWRRLAWFVSLWIGGVVALAVVAGLIRMWLTRSG